MRCPRCQHENAPIAKFCEECAAPLARTCSNCNTDLSPTAKFCPECARPVERPAQRCFAPPEVYTPKHLAEKIINSKAALEGERKQVTVLFADVKGSMELLADQDPEDVRKLLDPVLERMMDAVHRYEGTINQVMGDGIMALFGAPVAHEDHAVRACYAALQMQDAVGRYSDELRRSEGIEVQIRVGLNSGGVLVRSIGSDLRMDYTAIGQTTHLASRMEQLATPGSIRITAGTLALAEGHVTVKALGPVPVKGLREPVDIYELIGPGMARTRFEAAAGRGLSRFVGRDREMEQLRGALGKAARGLGQVVAVVGEPGVGKSRLFYEFVHSHRTRGWSLMESGSDSYGSAILHLPIIGLLKYYFRIQDRDEPRDIREKVTGRLITLDEELRPLLPVFLALLNVQVEDPDWEALDAPRRRLRTLSAVTKLLIRESQMQPVCMVVEDLHWIDAETQEVLNSLVGSLPTARILLLINYRPEYQHTWGEEAHYAELRIDPLPTERAQELLLAILGEDPGLAPLTQLLIRRTDGNPFFLEESVRTLVETDALSGERGAYRLARSIEMIQVPASVQAVLAARIDRLPTEDKKLLQSAAVVGYEVPFAILREIAELPEERLKLGLADLQAGEFLQESKRFPELEYTFKHALTHEVVYDGILRSRRRQLHARIVETMRRLYVDLGSHIEGLAYHAFAGEAWEDAVSYLRQAGARALARSAYRNSTAHFEQALAALRHLPETSLTLERAIDLRFDLRNSLHPVGDLQRALGYLREAEGLAHTLNDQQRLGWVSIYTSGHLWQVGDTSEALASAERAKIIAERLSDFPLQVAANFYVGQAWFVLGQYKQAEIIFQDNVRMLQDDRRRQLLGLAGLPSVLSGSYLAWTLAEQGEFVNGLAHGQDAVRIAEATDHRYSLVLASWRLARLYEIRGETQSAMTLLERAVGLCRESDLTLLEPYVMSSLGSTYALAGRLSDGLSLLRRAIDAFEAVGLGAFYSLTIIRLAEACKLVGEYEEAMTHIRRAMSLAVERGERGSEAYALHLLADVAGSSGSPDREMMEGYCRQAMDLSEQLGMRPLVAHCHFSLSKLYRRTDRRAEATEHLSVATTMYREMGMVYWLEQA